MIRFGVLDALLHAPIQLDGIHFGVSFEDSHRLASGKNIKRRYMLILPRQVVKDAIVSKVDADMLNEAVGFWPTDFISDDYLCSHFSF
jgi:hypothetical protein